MNYLLTQEQFAFLNRNKDIILTSEKYDSIFLLNGKIYSKKIASEVITESVAGVLGNIGDWTSMGIESIADMVDGWDVKDWLHLGVDVLAVVLGVIFPGVGDKAVEVAHLIWWGFEYYDADQANNDSDKTEAALNMAAISMLGLVFPVAGAAAMTVLKAPFKIMGKVVGALSKFGGNGIASKEVSYAVKQTVGKDSVTHFMTKAQLDAFAKAEPELYKQGMKESGTIVNFFKKLGKKIDSNTVNSVEIKTLSMLDKWRKALGNSTFAKPFKFIITILDYLISSLKNIFNSFKLMLIVLGRTPAVDVLDQEYLGNSIEDTTHAGVESLLGTENSRSSLILPIKYTDNVNFIDGVYLITIRLNSYKDLEELTKGKSNKEAPGEDTRYYYVVGSMSDTIPIYTLYAYDGKTKNLYAGFLDNSNNTHWMTAKELGEFTGKEYSFEFVTVDSMPEDDKMQYDHVRSMVGSIDRDNIKKFTNFRKALKDLGVEHPKLTGDYYKMPEIDAYRKSIPRKNNK
jgi:hypothetical protein